jgi:glutathione reductase (NADPH)
MEREYDVVVIGTGVAGDDVADHCSDAGLRVAIADYRRFGGPCALRGCVPKKVLVGAAEVVARVRDQQGKGIAGDVSIDWPELIAFEHSFTDPTPERKEERYRKKGIDAYHGFARFIGPNTVNVDNDTLTARHIVIATGAKPRPLDVPGADLMTSSDEFLHVEHLPKRIIFIGGGYISFEFSHIAARAGAEVTILQRGERVLNQFDPDLVDRLVLASREAGIDVRLNMPLKSIEKIPGGLRVYAGREGDQIFEASMVVHGAGRVSAIDGLDLEKGNVETDRRGIKVNEYLQSVSNPAVYVVGDANPKSLQLVPVVAVDAHIVIDNIINGNSRTADYSVVPSAVFTIPPIASVGLTEEAAKRLDIAYSAHTGDLSSRLTYRRIGQKYAGYKLLIDDDSRRILGAHLLGDHMEEVINIFALAMKNGLTVDDLTLDAVPWAYPTSVYDIIYMIHRLVRL